MVLENGYELCLTDKNRDGIIKNFELMYEKRSLDANVGRLAKAA